MTLMYYWYDSYGRDDSSRTSLSLTGSATCVIPLLAMQLTAVVPRGTSHGSAL